MKIFRESSKEFNRTLAADAYLLDNELRRRLDPKAVAAIPNINQSLIANDGTAVDPASLFDDGNHVGGLIGCQLAGTLQRLSKLLPIASQ